MTEILDGLYQKSKDGKSFNRLMDIVRSDNNIRLAFRMIKTNTGSNTAGTDGITIKEIKDSNIEEYVQLIKEKLKWYKPNSVKRVYIPKANGKTRPLGIPTMVDRIIQQCIKQVLEPICEAQFHPHSYGFRPNRSSKHALSRMATLINTGKFYYTVDIDIKGFFDNVNHTKLIKQLYSLGIQDRKLLSVIKEMLKAPIQGIGIPSKGTPQGGILSPLLANVVLNEFDWWISSQWETFETVKRYKTKVSQKNQLRKTNLKQIHIVRYADDFKIMCKDFHTAKKIYEATTRWLKTRLKLDISDEKSKIINLKKNSSDFLGFKIKAVKLGKSRHGYVVHSHVCDKALSRLKEAIKQQVSLIYQEVNSNNVTKLNSMILGWQEYYKSATHVSIDFAKLAFSVKKFMHHKLRQIAKYGVPVVEEMSPIHQRLYGNSKLKIWKLRNVYIYPISYVKHERLLNFSQDICDYSPSGRAISSKKLTCRTRSKVIELARRYNPYESAEYNDNRISRASMCGMKCEVTGLELDVEQVQCHHVTPRHFGGTDEYQNLKIVHKAIHKLIHATNTETIRNYRSHIINQKALEKLNELRRHCKLDGIYLTFDT
ncbi:group II intron reverse transcriptase/maturase [Domibacillus indicus]|uniref:group II intron reverse transcriptase/maturase n=1 Tax=Domibacillus indicus TaxID=1437523 RepID=UPI00204035A0|nr:group II intron reverse transcriptase/maturase [Domibacillus indicus]MCM3790610.1 group II intron reverse transcriptase/maturase [Domibacillus indicus]